MLAIKVPLKIAEKVKKRLLSSDNIDFHYRFEKVDDHIYFPLTAEVDMAKYESCEIVDYDLKENNKSKSFREYLLEILNDEELSLLKTAFDTVGTIAIIEVDAKLRHKEVQIGECLLKANKQIKTVLRKDGSHEGTFRTQKMKFLAGINTKETIHKENNVQLKMNVEDVYYSVRMSTERKRISELVKKDEDVLVMFSGCAPYPCVLGKNTQAKQVYGVELNPNGYNFGLENVRLNKLDNVFLLNGNVDDVVPNFYKHNIGLKLANNPEQNKTRLIKDPKIVEIHTFDHDFSDKIKFELLKDTIKNLQKDNIQVFVHQPLSPNVDLTENLTVRSEPYRSMVTLIDELNVSLIIHPVHDKEMDSVSEKLVKNVRTFEKYYHNIYFENGMRHLFSQEDAILDFIKRSRITNFCIDLSHFLYSHNNDNNALVEFIKKIQARCSTYFHVADANNDDSCILNNESNIDLEKILPLITKGVIEVRSENEDIGKEMIESYDYLNNYSKKFDRILMPLPKSAEDFLDAALSAAKDETILHFYDFLHEDKFYEAEEKVRLGCLKNGFTYEKLDFVKCGQHSPRTYRICLDVKLIKKD